MVYRNNPYRPNIYAFNNNPLIHDTSLNNHDLNQESIKIEEEIPLPNNIENDNSQEVRKSHNHHPSIIDFFKERINIEEIILIGIIIVLLIEGVEDEFLLLMLAYILLF